MTLADSLNDGIPTRATSRRVESRRASGFLFKRLSTSIITEACTSIFFCYALP